MYDRRKDKDLHYGGYYGYGYGYYHVYADTEEDKAIDEQLSQE